MKLTVTLNILIYYNVGGNKIAIRCANSAYNLTVIYWQMRRHPVTMQ